MLLSSNLLISFLELNSILRTYGHVQKMDFASFASICMKEQRERERERVVKIMEMSGCLILGTKYMQR